jgi:hypothetical protein
MFLVTKDGRIAYHNEEGKKLLMELMPNYEEEEKERFSTFVHESN